MRGEHAKSCRFQIVEPGSSPHARGALDVAGHHEVVVRLIPACAGSTRGVPPRGRTDRAHPRMRGEHLKRLEQHIAARGSSPHARGAPALARPDAPAAGLIPACAGSTSPTPPHDQKPGARPRMRGEHKTATAVLPVFSGSSPHARGARRTCEPDGPDRGLIPACAGSTPRSTASRRPRRAHPRVRGEHRSARAMAAVWVGSSPRARGARASAAPSLSSGGLIPACAGSTR